MPEDYFDNYEMPGRKMNPYRGWNAEIAYKQTIFQALGITDGFYSKGEKIGRYIE